MAYNIRFAIRSIISAPTFTLLFILIMAFAIGANITIFNFINLLSWRELPVAEPERFVSIWTGDKRDELDNYGWNSFPDYEYYRDKSEVFEGVLAWMVNLASLSGADGQAEWTECWSVTGNYFSLLGVGASLGRPFSVNDDEPDSPRVAVISYGLWQRRYAGASDVVGKSLRLNGHEFTIIGVGPKGFTGNWAARQADMWVPMKNIDVLRSPEVNWFYGSSIRWLGLIGRLRPEVSLAAAQSSLWLMGDQLQQLYPEEKRTRKPYVVPAKMVPPSERGWILPNAKLLATFVLLLLLVACFNTATLLLLRGIARQKEMATRMALGATTVDLARQLLTYYFMLSMLSGLAGLALGILGNKLVASYVKEYSHDLNYDIKGILFAIVLSLATPLIFGLLPAWTTARSDLVLNLKGGREALPKGPRLLNFRSIATVIQITIAVTLTVSAGLLNRSLQIQRQVDIGFDSKNVVLTLLNLAQKGYSPSEGKLLFERLLERVENLPGINNVSMVRFAPLSRRTRAVDIRFPGRQGQEISVNFNVVSPGYFDTFRIPVEEGRVLDERDSVDSPGAIVISRAFADMAWPDGDPIGRVVSIDKLARDDLGARFEIVGVVSDSHYDSITDTRPEPIFYVSVYQKYQSTMQLATRTVGDPIDLLPRLRAELASLDADLALGDVTSLEKHVEDSIWEKRMYAEISALFSLAGLALAALGIFSVMSYSIGRRFKEFGLRRAFGARRQDIFRLVLNHGMAITLAGVGVGLLLSYWTTRIVSRFVFGVSLADPSVLAAVTLVTFAVALAACFVPAIKATRVKPLEAIRHE